MLRCRQTDVMRTLCIFGCLHFSVGLYLRDMASVNYCKNPESAVCKVRERIYVQSPIGDVCVRSFSIAMRILDCDSVHL